MGGKSLAPSSYYFRFQEAVLAYRQFLVVTLPFLLLSLICFPSAAISRDTRAVSITRIAKFDHAQVARLNWSADGRYLATAGLGGLVNWLGVVGDESTTAVWDTKDKKLVKAGRRGGSQIVTTLIGKEPTLLTSYYSAPEDPDWRHTNGPASYFSLSHAKTGALIRHMPGNVPVYVLAYNSVANVLGGVLNHELLFYDTNTWNLNFRIPVKDTVSAMEFAPNGRKIAYAQYVNVEIFDLESRQTTLVFQPFNSPIASLTWSPDGKRLALLNPGIMILRPDRPALPGGDTLLKIWNAETGEFIRTFPDLKYGGEAGRPNLTWSADGRFIATVTKDRTVRLWSPDHETELARVAPEDKGHFAIAFSPTENVLAVATTKSVILYAVN